MFRKKSMNQKIQKWLFLTALIVLIQGCQKDDICPEGTETTPLLVIAFYDAEDPSRLKAVQNLVVQAEGEDVLLGPTTTNTISIPLRTTKSITEYRLVANSGMSTENEDRISFSYDPAPQYLNRACGYKVNFKNMDANTLQDVENWIISEIIVQENVENETEAHISITH
jgi:hypothetical protein